MHGFVLQDWITIRGGTGIMTITQTESEWKDLSHYEDFVAWVDIREITLTSGVTFVQFNLQTAPIKDEYLFVNMEKASLTATGALTVPAIRSVILSNSTNINVAVGHWVRWQLQTSGSPTGSWDAVFRIVCTANSVGGGGARGGGGGTQAMRPTFG